MAKERRQYTDEEKATALAALAANGGNVKKTALEIGVPRKTLERWANGGVHPAVAQAGHEKRLPLADVYEDIAYQCLGGLTQDKISKANAVELVKTAAIATDKMQLLRDKPTTIQRHDLSKMSDDELKNELDRLRERRAAIAGRIGGGPPSRNGAAGTSVA